MWLRTEAPAIDPVIAAGIGHLRLAQIHPFSDGNGRTARALTTLMLQRTGHSFNKLLAFERYFDNDKVRYCESIGEAVGPAFEEGRDITSWLEYFTFALSVEVESAWNAVMDLRRGVEFLKSKFAAQGYRDRHQTILAYAIINGTIRPREVMAAGKVSAETASSDLKRMVRDGLLTASGKGPSRQYKPDDSLWQKLGAS